jgi:uncharacterized membrane protein
MIVGVISEFIAECLISHPAAYIRWAFSGFKKGKLKLYLEQETTNAFIFIFVSVLIVVIVTIF